MLTSPRKTVTIHDYYLHHRLYHYDTYTPSTGRFTLTGFSATAVTPVPEPNVFALMLAGVSLVGFMSYRRQRQFNCPGFARQITKGALLRPSLFCLSDFLKMRTGLHQAS
jgi:hypothetical protein